MKALLHIIRFGGLYLAGLFMYAVVFWGILGSQWTWHYPALTHSLVAFIIWVIYGLDRIGKGEE